MNTSDIRTRILQTIIGETFPVVLVVPPVEAPYLEEYPEDSEDSALEWLQKRVGGYIERVALTACTRKGGPGIDIVCNEEGLFEPEPVLNTLATNIARSFGIPANLVGTVVIVGTKFTMDDEDEISGIKHAGLSVAQIEWMRELATVFGVKFREIRRSKQDAKPAGEPSQDANGREGQSKD